MTIAAAELARLANGPSAYRPRYVLGAADRLVDVLRVWAPARWRDNRARRRELGAGRAASARAARHARRALTLEDPRRSAMHAAYRHRARRR